MNPKKKLKILVADDTPQILRMIEMNLTIAGHMPITAVNGLEAVEKVKEHKPDMVLLDIMMPEMNGLEALLKIKKIAPNIPVAMVTASSANDHLKSALQNGADGYVTKPIQFKELNQLIQETIEKIELREKQAEIEALSRLAALGEMSGRIAHEVLNPLTAVLSKIEKMIDEESAPDGESELDIIQEIIIEWKQKYVNGELLEYLNQKIPNHEKRFNHAQEDFSDLDVLLRETKGQREKHLHELNFLHKHILRIIKIIDNLRGMARKSESLEKVNVNQLLRETKELLHDTLWKRGIQITENYTSGLPKVTADPNELLQVFTNLTKNGADAIDALPANTPPERKNITFATTLNGGYVEIKIIDKGEGIPKENWETIFESNFTTKSREKGTGLGLSISRRFIHNFDGEIFVENSVKGEGTSFLIQLPVAN